MFRNNRGDYFQNKQQFESWIMPLLKQRSKELSPLDMLKYKINNPNLADVLMILIILFGLFYALHLDKFIV
jgi:hypothetical protein